MRRALAMATLLAMSVLPALAACSSTKLTSTWVEPSVTTLSFNKVMVLALVRDPSIRRVAEDAAAASIKRGHAIAGYTVLSEEQLKDEHDVRAAVRAAGVDGIVTMRLVGVDKQLTYVPGSTFPAPYYSFWGYYNHARPVVYDPGYLRTDKIIQVETNVYSVAQNKLVYAARSETFNPTSTKRIVEEIAEAIAKDLKARKLIA